MKPLKDQDIMEDVLYVKKNSRKHRISDTSILKDDSYIFDEHLNQPARKKLKAFKELAKDDSASILSEATNFGKPNKAQEDDRGVRRLQLLQTCKEEDKIINRLGKILGINKRKKKGKHSSKNVLSAFTHDGLDYILEVLDKPDRAIERDLDLNEALPEHLGSKNSKYLCNDSKKCSVRETRSTHELQAGDELFDGNNSDNQCSAEESEMSDFINEDSVSDDDSQSDDLEVQSTRSVKIDKRNCETGESDVHVKKSNTKKQKHGIWEDIYGRLRDEEGNVLPNPTEVSQVYVPPHERMKQEPVSDERKTTLERIKKQLKGLINRLSESNMNRISNEVEEMYMKNSRNDMNETLMSILNEVLLSPISVPPRFAAEQAMLIGLLHVNIGSEIGAFFLQSLALKLDEFLQKGRNCEQGKECNNLLTFLCHLYNFKVTRSVLIFDILRLLLESFQEMDMELILLILKHAGLTLRKDDPLAFKEVLLSIQSKAGALKSGQNQSRINFMLDILIEVRNNNMEKLKKLLNYDSSTVEHLKKVLRGLVHKGSYIQELSISYKDLLNADERGRWWIVGSAWSERTSEDTTDETSSCTSSKSSCSEKILTLARKLHINTETRKIVFSIIMAAQDYMDAFECLLHLELKNQQEREIISVLLHCSLQEKNFNPYYSYLTSKFCKYDRRFCGYLKFALWDKFRELESMTSSQRNCLASLLVYLFTTESLDISVLKVIQFSEMNNIMVQFCRKILTAVLLHECEEVCCKVFQCISSNDNLQLLRESLRLFMHHFILHRKSEVDHSVAEKLKLRVKIAEDALNCAKHAFKL